MAKLHMQLLHTVQYVNRSILTVRTCCNKHSTQNNLRDTRTQQNSGKLRLCINSIIRHQIHTAYATEY